MNMTVGLSTALEAGEQLALLVASTASSLTVRDLQSESDRQLLYLPFSRAIGERELARYAEQAREVRARLGR